MRSTSEGKKFARMLHTRTGGEAKRNQAKEAIDEGVSAFPSSFGGAQSLASELEDVSRARERLNCDLEGRKFCENFAHAKREKKIQTHSRLMWVRNKRSMRIERPEFSTTRAKSQAIIRLKQHEK